MISLLATAALCKNLFVIKLEVFILIRVVRQGLLGRIVRLVSGAEVSVIIWNIEPSTPRTRLSPP